VIIVDSRLYNWLENNWKYNNHKKYHKYFEKWISNITENQIQSFNKMMERGDVYEKEK
jgi:uncharacterized protein YfdQ (DUF2303 family)